MWKILYDGLNNFSHIKFEPGKLKEHYIRIKPEFIGICGSDKNIVLGGKRKGLEPISLGHEILGEIVDGTGLDMTGSDIRAGDTVVVFPNYDCGTCQECITGHTNTCRNKISIGVTADGGLIEVVDIPSRFLLKMSSNIDKRLAVLTEPVAVVLRALSKFGDRSLKLIIVGGGSTGTLAYILSRIMGFHNVIILEAMTEKMSVLKTKGFPVIQITEYMNDEVNLMDGPLNVLDTVGKAVTVEFWTKLVGSSVSGSNVIVTGLDEYEFDIPQSVLIRKELRLEGSIIYNKDDFVKAGEIMENHSKNFEPLIDYEGGMKDIEDWLIPAMKRKDILKIIIKL